MAAKLTTLTHKIAIQLHLVANKELYHLQLSLQAASPKMFGYTLILVRLFSSRNDRIERLKGSHVI
jgi:hypothetical protein